MLKEKRQSFSQSIFTLMFSQVIIKIFGIIYKLYLTNRPSFGDKGNAIYSGAFQAYMIVLSIGCIGIPNAVSKLISERIGVEDYVGAKKIFKISFLLLSIIGFVGCLFLFLFAHTIANNFLAMPETELSIIILAPAVFFESIIAVFKGYFNGCQNMRPMAKSQTIEQALKTIFTIIFVEIICIFVSKNTKIMVAGANLATTFSTFVSLIYLFSIYFKERSEAFGNSKISAKQTVWEILKSIIAIAMPMTMSAILGSINKNIDSITIIKGLRNFLSESEAQIQYGILSGKIDMLVTMPLSFNIAFATALVPAVSSAKAVGDYNSIKNKVEFSLLINMLIGLPCCLGICLFAEPILNLLFPNASQGAFILQISSISIIFLTVEQTVIGTLQGLGKTLAPLIGMCCGAVAKIIINVSLVKINPETFIFGGIAGAAVGTVVCHIISTLFGMFQIGKNLKLKLNFTNFLLKPVIATIMMGIVAIILHKILPIYINKNLSLIISILISAMFYIITIFQLKVINIKDIKIFRRV